MQTLVVVALCALAVNASDIDKLNQLKEQVANLEKEIETGDNVLQPHIGIKDSNLNIRLPRDAHMTMTRRQTVDITDLNDRVNNLETNSKVAAYEATMNASAGLMGAVASSLASVSNEQAKFKKTLNDQVEESFDNLMDQMNELKQKVDSDSSTFKASMNELLDNTTKQLTTMVNSATSDMQKSNKRDIDEMKALVAGLSKDMKELEDATKLTYIWIGGTTSSYRRGWREMNLNREELNTGDKYFKKEGNRFKALKDGFFRLEYGGIMHGGWCHAHYEIWIDNKRIRDANHMYIPGTWQDTSIETTYYLKANQKMWLRVYGCNYASHGSSRHDAHNRLTFAFVGLKGSKCSGIYCKGI